MSQQQFEFKFPKGGIFFFIALFIAIIIISKSFVVIGAGKAGVLYKPLEDGVVTDKPPLGEGFHVVMPWNSVIIYVVRQQEWSDHMKVLSSNGLDIRLDATAWYQPHFNELGKLYQEKGLNYLDDVIRPAIRSAARSVVGRYTPDQLYSSKRDVIQQEIYDETKILLDEQYVQLNKILIRDIELPEKIKNAISRKLDQEQISLEYEFRLETARKEAEKKIIEADGKAKANRILNASLTNNILREKGIQATLELAKSPNSKVVVIGSGEDGMPLILGK